MYKDELEETTTQITSLKKELDEHRESHHLRSVMLDRQILTSSPIHKKNNVAQRSITESGVERSCSGTDDFSFKKQGSDKKHLFGKKWTLVQCKPVKPCHGLKRRQFLKHRSEKYNLTTIFIVEVKYYFDL
jgi:hypothetical protein